MGTPLKIKILNIRFVHDREDQKISSEPKFPGTSNDQSEEELCAQKAHQVKFKSFKQEMCEAINSNLRISKNEV